MFYAVAARAQQPMFSGWVTDSRRDLTSKRVAGPFEATQLEPLESGNYFAFAWPVFYPETEIFTE